MNFYFVKKGTKYKAVNFLHISAVYVLKNMEREEDLVICHLFIHAETVPCFGELLSFHSQEFYPLKLRSVNHLGRGGGT